MSPAINKGERRGVRNSWDYRSDAGTNWPEQRESERGRLIGGWRRRQIRYWLSFIRDWFAPMFVSVGVLVWWWAPLEVTKSLGYRVDRVRVEIKGCHEQLDRQSRIEIESCSGQLDQQALIESVKVQEGEPIFALELQVIAERLLKQHQWLEAVKVKRNLPNEIEVIAQERQPAALWRNLALGNSHGYGELWVVDRNGRLIEGIELRSAQEALEFSERFAHLPVVTGNNAPGHTSQLLTELKRVQGLEEKVIVAQLVDNRRWNLHLRENIVVQLPESEISERLQLLEALLTMEYHLPEGEVIDLQMADVIDLRPEKRIVVGYRTP